VFPYKYRDTGTDGRITLRLEDGIFRLRQDIADVFGFIPPSMTVSFTQNKEYITNKKWRICLLQVAI
jgi:hypothetical protein